MARHKLPFIDTLPAHTLEETKLHTILRQSPIHRMECLRVVDEIIENLDEMGLIELMGGTEQDVDGIIENMLYDTYSVLYTGNREIDFAPRYEQHISESIEEVLRCNNLTYFITSVIPDFQLSYHHLEWGDLVHHHKKLCIEAARDHGKCVAPETLIRMADGSEKKASEIVVGDEVMGIDLTPRKVLEVHTGHDEHMYRITNGQKNTYVVNSQHTLCLSNGKKWGKLVDIDIPTLLEMGEDFYRNHLWGLEVNIKHPIKNSIPIFTENSSEYFSAVKKIRIEDIGEGDYVGFEIDGDHRFLLANGVVTHNSYYFSNAYLAWQLYKYAPPKVQQFSRRPTASNSNRGFLFSFSLQQAVDLIEILKGTIESNDILRERLYPENLREGAWASTNIVCKNGARLTGKGFGSSVRGAHPYYIVVDDGLKDNVIYSQLQRQKSIDYFHSVIMNMLVPGGQICVVGTPFHAQDLYGDLKSKRGWFCIEYPAIFPNGKILWPQRWNFKDLMDKRATQGNIIFSRENLCRPIVSDSSIFPLSILKTSLVRMDNYTLVRNRDSYRKKFSKVVCGCDFSISSSVGADFYFYTVFGIDEDNGMWLMNAEYGKGKTFHEQLQLLRTIYSNFRPDVMVFESNVFQQIFTDEALKYGMPVVPHNTGVEKNDLSKGWCAIATAMERGMFHFPIGDEYSIKVKEEIFEQLGSVAFTDKGGIASVGAHDDACSSIWLAMLGRNISSFGFKFSFM